VQVCGILPAGGNHIAVNKYLIVILTVNHGTSCTTAVRVLSDRRRRRRRRGVNEVFVLLRCYAAWIGSQSPRFRENLSIQSSKIKQSTSMLKMGHLGFPQTWVTTNLDFDVLLTVHLSIFISASGITTPVGVVIPEAV